MKTSVKTLKVARLSSLPNKFGSFAYSILDADKPEVAELLEAVEGVYDATQGDGGKIIYSNTRLGSLNKPTNATIRVNEQVKDGNGTGRWFINLVDTSLDAFGGFADKVKLANRIGLGTQSVAAVAAFYGMGAAATEAVAAPVAVEDKVETPVGTE